MGEAKLFDWQQAFSSTYESAVRLFTDNFPKLVGTIIILLAGLILAWMLRLVARKLTLAIEAVILRSARHQGIPAPGGLSYSTLIGNIVFWAVLIFFLASGAKQMGWSVFSDTLRGFLSYFPSIFAGVFIILAGFVVGRMTRSLVKSMAQSAGMLRPEFPARIAQIAVTLTALMIGIEQFGINIGFLTTAIIVVIGVGLAGAALAFALGARQYVANLIGVQVCHRHYQLGQWINLPDAEGFLIEITQTALVLDTERGRLLVPASLLQQQVSEIITDKGESGETSSSILGNLFRKKDEFNGP